MMDHGQEACEQHRYVEQIAFSNMSRPIQSGSKQDHARDRN